MKTVESSIPYKSLKCLRNEISAWESYRYDSPLTLMFLKKNMAGDRWVKIVEQGSSKPLLEARAMQRILVQLTASESRTHGRHLTVNLLKQTAALKQSPQPVARGQAPAAARASQRFEKAYVENGNDGHVYQPGSKKLK